MKDLINSLISNPGQSKKLLEDILNKKIKDKLEEKKLEIASIMLEGDIKVNNKKHKGQVETRIGREADKRHLSVAVNKKAAGRFALKTYGKDVVDSLSKKPEEKKEPWLRRPVTEDELDEGKADRSEFGDYNKTISALNSAGFIKLKKGQGHDWYTHPELKDHPHGRFRISHKHGEMGFNETRDVANAFRALEQVRKEREAQPLSPPPPPQKKKNR